MGARKKKEKESGIAKQYGREDPAVLGLEDVRIYKATQASVEMKLWKAIQTKRRAQVAATSNLVGVPENGKRQCIAGYRKR